MSSEAELCYTNSITTEDELTAELAKIFAHTANDCVEYGIGDDCALVAVPSGSTLISTDILVEGVHFKSEWSSPADIARRAFAQNLADIAASGGIGTAMVVSLILPKSLGADKRIGFALEFARALAQKAKENGVAIVGGDLSSGSEIVVNITVFGELISGVKQVRRDGAKPGDVVAIAGMQGLSLTGYEFYAGVRSKDSYSEDFVQKCKSTYLAPDPPYAMGPIAAKHGATAMCDVSDGLLKDCSRIAKMSNVAVRLHSLHIVKENTQNQYQNVESAKFNTQIPLENYYFGGEDHCLLATFPSPDSVPNGFTIIGECLELDASTLPQFTSGIILDDDLGLREIIANAPKNRQPKQWDHIDNHA